MLTKYEPACRLTVRETLTSAIRKAKGNNRLVFTVINDVVMFVNKNTNIDAALTEYQQKLDLKYYTNKIKRIRRK